MNIDNRTLKVLEWDKILESLSKYATSDLGKQRCFNAEIHTDFNKIKHELSLTTEAKYILDLAITPPLGGIRNIQEFIEAARASQTLRNYELIDIAHTIQASRKLKTFFSKYTEETPKLHDLSIGLFESKYLEDEIFDKFDEAGNMLDTASPELKRLRTSYKDQMANLKNKLNSLINSSISKYLQETVYTQRGDRYVLPVKAEFKSNVPGIVHDSSSSGATLFIEPKSIVELNNKIREIELQTEVEVNRILAELSSKVKESAESILWALELLAEIDFHFAKAKYSIYLKATEPTLNTNKFINLKSVKHPVLISVLENVIPNDVEIGKNWNVMIITGSNTGGKTVILKTVGLCTLMTKAGMHVPAVEANIYPFNKVFADIGDEQSVVQSLSTFSGHMVNIINILNNTDDNSLVLLDEAGAGTDPAEGSSLAQAILESLHKKGTRTIVTTHYGELKALAYTKQGFYNASVEFDIESLAPTYKLLMGIPGKSNAITIAANLGLSSEIAQEAQKIYITQKDTTGEVLEGLQNTQQQLSKDAQAVESTKEELEKLEKEYTVKLDRINEEKKKTINVYKKKFDSAMTGARQEIKQILEEVRRTKSEKVARRAFNRLSQIESGLRGIQQQEQEELAPEFQPINWDKVQVGDTVFVKDLEQPAILLSLPDKNNNVQVEIGMLKTNTKAKNIVQAGKEHKAKIKTAKTASRGVRFERHNVSNTLDLRGTTIDDALDRLDKYLDDVSLASLSPVYIIHGHGTGALRKAVRDYLSDSPYVAKFRSGEQSEGGDGVSIVDIA